MSATLGVEGAWSEPVARTASQIGSRALFVSGGPCFENDLHRGKFPGGAQVALIVTINLEYWEPFRPGQKEPLFAGGPATIPHALPGDVLDTANWTWREYGQRVGVWRLLDAFDAAGMAPSCTCNGLMLTERARIIAAVKERGWELVPHNWAQNDLLTFYAHRPDDERAVIRRTLDTYLEVVGKPAKAWLSSAIGGTPYTPAYDQRDFVFHQRHALSFLRRGQLATVLRPTRIVGHVGVLSS